jgi:hypothetical protein
MNKETDDYKNLAIKDTDQYTNTEDQYTNTEDFTVKGLSGTSFPSPNTGPASSDDRERALHYHDDAVDKAIASPTSSVSEKQGPHRVRRPRHPRGKRVSKIERLDFERLAPSLWKGILEFPAKAVSYYPHGIFIQEAVYRGMQRNGPSYFSTWIDENHISLSENGLLILQALMYYQCFTTYDEILSYVNKNNWGDLKVEKVEQDPKNKDLRELAIIQAIARKNERIQKLMLFCKEYLKKYPDSTEERLIRILREKSIRDFGVSLSTARGYAKTAVYSLKLIPKVEQIKAEVIIAKEKQDRESEIIEKGKRVKHLEDIITVLHRNTRKLMDNNKSPLAREEQDLEQARKWFRETQERVKEIEQLTEEMNDLQFSLHGNRPFKVNRFWEEVSG